MTSSRSEVIIAKIVFSFVLIPLSIPFTILMDLIIRPIVMSCAYSGCYQNLKRSGAIIFAFLIAYPVFYLTFFLISFLSMFSDIYWSIYEFYKADTIEVALNKLFLYSFTNNSIDEYFGLIRKDKDHYFGYIDHGPLCEKGNNPLQTN